MAADRLYASDFEHPLQPHPLNPAAPLPQNRRPGKAVSIALDGEPRLPSDTPPHRQAALSRHIAPIDPLVFGDGGPVARRHRAAGDLVQVDPPSPAQLAAAAAAQTAAAAASRYRGKPAQSPGETGDPLLAPTPTSNDAASLEDFGLYDAPFDEMADEVTARRHANHNIPQQPRYSSSANLRENVLVGFNSNSGDRNSAGSFLITSTGSCYPLLRGLDRDPSLPSPNANLVVTRTIADFMWLEQRLRTTHDTVIIPTLPPMNVAGRIKFGYAYVDARRRGFERFLRRIISHAELEATEEVSAFLGLEGEKVWEHVRTRPPPPQNHQGSAAPPAQTPQRPHGLLANIQEQLGQCTEWTTHKLWQTGRHLNQGLGVFLTKRHDFDGARDPRDDPMQRLRAYVRELEASLHSLKRAVERANAKQVDLSRAENLLEASLKRVATCESGRFQEFLDAFARCVEVESSLNKPIMVDGVLHSSDSSEWQLQEVLGDFVQRSEGAHRLVLQRLEEQDLYERKLEVYRKQRDKIEYRVAGTDTTETSGNSAGPAISRSLSGKDLTHMQSSLCAAAADLAATRKQYESVAISTNAELRRFRVELHQETSAALTKLAKERLRKHEETAKSWELFLADLGDLAVSGGTS